MAYRGGFVGGYSDAAVEPPTVVVDGGGALDVPHRRPPRRAPPPRRPRRLEATSTSRYRLAVGGHGETASGTTLVVRIDTTFKVRDSPADELFLEGAIDGETWMLHSGAWWEQGERT